jgi:hypothetical protein
VVQTAELTRLREEWKAKGDRPCDHPRVSTEFYLGARTGDVGCLICGVSWAKGSKPPEVGLESAAPDTDEASSKLIKLEESGESLPEE